MGSTKPKKRLTRPNLVDDAAKVLDLQPRTGRRLAAAGKFGRLRRPTLAERQKFGIAFNARVVTDMRVVQRLKKAREAGFTIAVLKQRRKARRARR